MTLWIVFGAYFVLLLALGELFGRLKIRDLDDHLLSGREHGMFVTTASLVATVIGAGSTLGSAAVTYYVGASAGWYLLSAGPGLLLLGYTLAPRLRELSLYSVPGYVDRRYGDRAGLLAAGLGVLALALFLSAQFYAMGSLVVELTGIPLRPAIVASAAVVLLYTLRGGNWAVHWSDSFQVVLIVVGVVATVAFLLQEVGGWAAFAEPPVAAGFDDVGREWFHPIGRQPLRGWDPLALGDVVVAWVVMSTTWHFAMQSTAQRILSGRDQQVVRRSCVLAALATLPLGALFAITDMGARLLLPELPAPGPMELLEQVRALLALVEALLDPAWAGLGLLGLGGALVAPGLVQTLEMVAGVYTVALFGPLVLGRYWDGASEAGALASMVASGSAAILWRATPLEETTGIHLLNLALPLSLLALWLGSRVWPRGGRG